MSIIRYRDLSLSEIIEQSNLVLEVKFLKAYQEEVAISHKDPSLNTESFPPFIKKGNVFRVNAVLKNPDKLKIPETIQVPHENWRRFLGQHKERHLNAPSKSYTVLEYITEVKSVAKAGILFLNHFQGMYELTAHNAFESIAALEKVTMIVASE